MSGDVSLHSRRCSKCELNWPYEDKFAVCLVCRRVTWLSNSGDYPPMSDAECLRLIAEVEMDRIDAERLEESVKRDLEALDATGVEPTDEQRAEWFKQRARAEIDLLMGWGLKA